jgi:hypothetical protein
MPEQPTQQKTRNVPPLTKDELSWKEQAAAEALERQFKALFEAAGLPVTRAFRLENCYWPRAHDYQSLRNSSPWFLMMTPYGPVMIGWRKRVIHIEWTETGVKGVVTTDDVTKDPQYVHAWTVEKALEYLRALAKLLRSEVGRFEGFRRGYAKIDNNQLAIGFYHPEGGTRGEFVMEWTHLSQLGLVPQLQVFDDGWDALAAMPDLLKELRKLDDKKPTREQIIDLLRCQGYVEVGTKPHQA